MTEYDIEELKQMTVARYIELRDSENEDDNDLARDATANISLYLYANADIVDDLDIDEEDVVDNKFIMSARFEAVCEDYPIIQCDADDFIEQDVRGDFEDIIEIDVTPEMTFMEIAEKLKDQIEIEADRVIESAAESAAEDHGPHRSYWWSR